MSKYTHIIFRSATDMAGLALNTLPAIGPYNGSELSRELHA